MKDQTVLITGATGTIGTDITIECLKESPQKLILLGRNKDQLLHLQNISKAYHIPCNIYVIDLFDLNTIESFVEQHLDHHINIVLYCHGYLNQSLFINSDLEEMKKEFDINYWSIVYFSKYIIDLWINNNTVGQLIVISSLAANLPSPTMSIYSASKAALSAWIKSIYGEIKEYNILFKQVVIGLVKDTGMTKNISLFKVPDYSSKYIAKTIVKQIVPNNNSYHTIGTLVDIVDRFSNLSPTIMHVISQYTKPDI